MSKKLLDPGVSKSSIPTYLLGIGAMFVTLVFQTRDQDPFNLPKFIALLALSIFSLYLIFTGDLKRINTKQLGFFVTLIFLFLTSFLASSLFSGNTYQSFVGVYQRNLGLITYACFSLLLFAVLFQNSLLNAKKFLMIFVATGTLEMLYGLIQLSGLDPLKWKNPYSPIIGTFGNPNYQSAFLGITAAAAVSLIVTSAGFVRLFLIFQVVCSLFLILSSNSSQGFMSFMVATTVIFLNYIRTKGFRYFLLTLSLILSLYMIGILGILQIGPASFLYQSSISARGDYWRIAIYMMNSNPLSGVGIERYGEYFSEYRDIQQVTGRSYATYSDNAHNVFLHFGATGGYPLLISYLALFIAIIAIGVMKLRKENTIFSLELSTFVGLFLGFVAISLISPENIGFTIWAWLIGGFILGLGLRNNSNPRNNSVASVNKTKWISLIVCLSLFFPLGTFAYKVLKADKDIWQAYSIAYSGSGSLVDLMNRIQSITTLAPLEQRYKLLGASLSLGLDQKELARSYAMQVLEINSRSIDAHNIIALTHEKEEDFKKANEVREIISEIDPYNLYNFDRIARNFAAVNDSFNAKKYLEIMRNIQANNSLVVLLEEYLRG